MYADLTVSQPTETLDRIAWSVKATGGSRRHRGAALASFARRHPGGEWYQKEYSETYGFLPATYACYAIDLRKCAACGGPWHNSTHGCTNPKREGE
jgi:hypothetical protein